ncbi:ATP-dependent RNA helicase DeaD [Mesonia phycicola]|uniref:RNA helicase n=1 Tax=Mesonia phycicola TaxID=579105 RepID=A0A1M6DSI5_9FLAO|nr:DEAD/DEAH box helicase [Mesonia phycicola]SHI76182.1 ATP-dependent RNA helicase DeaD [Mesonia phycicola]
MNKFEQLGLNAEIVNAVNDMGFESPSAVQEQAIPILLQNETDLVALAQTGTGKTAAFGFPLIQKINASSKKTQGLILSPTRELCLQITNELKNYSKYIKQLNTVAIYGGSSITDQERQIKRGAQIIVATPGRMKDMVGRGMIDISEINYCVLDEADEMLNMGFFEDITDILSHTPKEKKTWLFSATMPKEVAVIAKKFMKEPQEITVGSKNEGSKNVSHEYYITSGRDRYQALKRLADANPDIFSVIFCRTKRDTQKVAERLIEDGYSAGAIHGDLSQNQRDLVMKSFRSRQIQMLVATDVAARGIDVDDITHVINYQLPDEIETYTHRSGRTGRAGKSGVSMVIVSRSEVRKIKGIERIIKQSFEQKDIPSGEEICQVQLFHLANSIKDTTINTEIDKFLPQLEEILKDSSKEELIKKFFSVEFTRFFNYYKNASDLNSKAKNDSFSDDGDSTRYFINIGSKDGFDWMSLKDFLKEHLDLGRDAVSRVDVKDSFSFFNTDTAEKDKVLAAFENYQHEGRNVNVEETKSQGGGGRNRKGRSGGGKSGGRRNNNFKRSSSSSSDGGRRSSSRRGSSESSGGGRKSNIKSSISRRRNKNS